MKEGLLHLSALHHSYRHLLCHDRQAVDGGSPVLHECEEIVKEAFSGWVHVELVQLPSQVIEISKGKLFFIISSYIDFDMSQTYAYSYSVHLCRICSVFVSHLQCICVECI